MEVIKDFELTKEEKEKYELSLDEIVALEDKDIDLMKLMTDLAENKYPKTKTMIEIVRLKDKEVKHFSDVMTTFVKILIATVKKN